VRTGKKWLCHILGPAKTTPPQAAGPQLFIWPEPRAYAAGRGPRARGGQRLHQRACGAVQLTAVLDRGKRAVSAAAAAPLRRRRRLAQRARAGAMPQGNYIELHHKRCAIPVGAEPTSAQLKRAGAAGMATVWTTSSGSASATRARRSASRLWRARCAAASRAPARGLLGESSPNPVPQLIGLKAKLYAKKRHSEKIVMKRTIAQHSERNNKHKAEEEVAKGAVPHYLLDREQASTLSPTPPAPRRMAAWPLRAHERRGGARGAAAAPAQD